LNYYTIDNRLSLGLENEHGIIEDVDDDNVQNGGAKPRRENQTLYKDHSQI